MELLTSMEGKIIMIILGGVALAMLCFLCTTELRLRKVESKTKSYFDEIKNESRELTDALGIHKLYHQDRHVYITQDKESHPFCANSFTLNWVDPLEIISICLPKECSGQRRYETPKIELIDKTSRIVLLSNGTENFYIVSIDKRTVIPIGNKIISTLLNKDDK